ncbi:50S ribosomal protein L6 [Candidatus Burarchaeum australiense]|nr:50S ribosomal protein L6 [Candidatus Burarchaeum australiense]
MSISVPVSASIKMPEGVTAQLDGTNIVVSGKAGKSRRSFDPRKLKVEVKGGEILLESTTTGMLNTFSSHVKNMALGASEGYTVNMKTLHSHFPMSFELKGKALLIKNFLGEKKPRHSPIAGDTKVEVKGTDLKISGPSKDDVGQTVANIKTTLRIRKRDSRVFQDGLYEVEE